MALSIPTPDFELDWSEFPNGTPLDDVPGVELISGTDGQVQDGYARGPGAFPLQGRWEVTHAISNTNVGYQGSFKFITATGRESLGIFILADWDNGSSVLFEWNGDRGGFVLEWEDDNGHGGDVFEFNPGIEEVGWFITVADAPGGQKLIRVYLDTGNGYELRLETTTGFTAVGVGTQVLFQLRDDVSWFGPLTVGPWVDTQQPPTPVGVEAAIEVESDAAAALRATRRIAASLECETDADIEAAIARVLASVAEVEPDAAALVRPTRGVTAAVEGEGDAATAVQPARSIAAPLESETELHAQLVVTAIVQLAAVLEAEGAVTGGLRVARELAAVVDAEVVADAAPEVRRLLAAQLAADADAAARLHVARALAAALEADVDASAALFLATLLLTTLSVHVVGAGRSAMASEVAGPALARVVQGPALSRDVLGPAVRRFDIEGPAAS